MVKIGIRGRENQLCAPVRRVGRDHPDQLGQKWADRPAHLDCPDHPRPKDQLRGVGNGLRAAVYAGL